MKGSLAAVALALALFFLGALSPARAERYFGYYGNDADLSQNHDHINLHHIMFPPSDTTQATNYIIAELNNARTRGVKALVSVDTLIFNFQNRQCPAKARSQSEAQAIWEQFASRLVSTGHLLPNNPAASTIAGFYLIDEPELCGLGDTSEKIEYGPEDQFFFVPVNYKIRDAVGVIKGNTKTKNLPIATVIHSYTALPAGGDYFDWLGVTSYDASNSGGLAQSEYLVTTFLTWCEDRGPPDGAPAYLWFQHCKNWDRSPKKILIPQAATGGCGLDQTPHTPSVWHDAFKSDPNVAALIPFLWKTQNGGQCPGTKDLPVLRSEYYRIGRNIKTGVTP